MRQIIRLAVPVALTYLGMMTMGIEDMYFVGKLGPVSIGAVGLGSSIFSWGMVFGLGLLSGLDYLVAYAFGAKKYDEAHTYFIQGLLLSVVISIFPTCAMVFFARHLAWIHVNAAVISDGGAYLEILAYSLFPALAFTAFRLYLQALGAAGAAMVVLLLANGINIACNYAWVSGNWGFGAHGAAGAAWATLVSRIWMLLALGFYTYYKDHKRAWGPAFRVVPEKMRELVHLGGPAALQMTFEVGVFALSTILAARLSSEELAAHQIVLNTASVTFMVPLGIGSASAVLVGQALGRRQRKLAARTGWQGLALGVGYMAISSGVLLSFPEAILGFYTQDRGVLAASRAILLIAAFFQLSDGAQTVGTGALRGLGDTRSSMFINFGGHWLVGLPVGLWACFYLGLGLRGLWMGLSIGLTVVAIAVVLRWWYKTRSLLA